MTLLTETDRSLIIELLSQNKHLSDELRQSIELLVASDHHRETVIAELRHAINSYPADLIQANALFTWVYDVLSGETVSDFAESFPVVRLALSMRARLDAFEAER